MPPPMFGILCEQYRQFPLSELIRLRDMRLKRIDVIRETHVSLSNSGNIVLNSTGKSEIAYVRQHLAAIQRVITERQQEIV